MIDIGPDVKRKAQQAADRLLQQLNDPAAAVVIATEDGFDVASARASRATIDPARMAAMTSSITAIGQVVGQETGLGSSECLVTEAANGYVVMRTASCENTRLVLAAVASRKSVLGLMMHAVQACSRELRE